MPRRKTSFESILADTEIMDELRARSGSHEMRARAERFNVRPESLLETMERPPAPDVPPGINEAIIRDFGRPALLVQNDTFQDPDAEVWKNRLYPGRSRIDRSIRSVGRVEILGHLSYEWLGTAWMVSDRVAVTNRHVANIFAAREGEAFVFLSNPMGDPYSVRVDFKEEWVSPTGPPRENELEIGVAEVVFIEELGNAFPDLALIKLKAAEGALPPPIVLKDARPEWVAVVGYPAYDSRNAADSLDRVFGDIYNVKRFAPGAVNDYEPDTVFTHDCSTLGGNSGSVIIDVADGAAVGLHFGGLFHKANYAVKAKVVASRLKDMDIAVPVPETDDTGEILVEARTVGDYADREGYEADFLGSDFQVPLPVLTEAVVGQAAPVSGGGNELKYTHFSLVMNKDRRLAFYTACNIDGKELRRFPRGTDNWLTDPRVTQDHQADNFLYKKNDLDRGHLVRRLDPVWGSTAVAEKAQDDTFHYTNAAPQHKNLNQKTWLDLEDHILDNVEIHDLKVSVMAGPVFNEDDRSHRGVGIPREFWKVITLVKALEDGGRELSATAYLLSQADMITDLEEFVFGQFKTFQVGVGLIEEKTKMSFGNLADHDPFGKQEIPVRGRALTDPREILI